MPTPIVARFVLVEDQVCILFLMSSLVVHREWDVVLVTMGELPFLGNGPAERSPELFFAKHALTGGTIAEIGNVSIPGVSPDLCVDLFEGPVKEDARCFRPPVEFDNVISISTIEHFGTGRHFDWTGPIAGLKNIVMWIKPGGFFYVTVPFGKPTQRFKRQAGPYLVQYYPPQQMETFMPFTGEYIGEFRHAHKHWLKFLFLKRTDIRGNKWAWCDESDVRDCEMADDGATALLIITSRDLRQLDISDLSPVMILGTEIARGRPGLLRRLARVVRDCCKGIVSRKWL